MSTLSVDMIEPVGSTLTLGQSGDAIAVPSGVVFTNSGTATGFGGKVGQVLQATKTDAFTTTSSVWTDITDLSIAITPTATTSKILVFMNVNGIGTTGASGGWVKIVRDSTSIAIGDAAGSRQRASNAAYDGDGGASMPFSTVWLDSPATTSAVTYKVQCFTQTTATFYVNRTQADADAIGYARSVSTITVMEITA